MQRGAARGGHGTAVRQRGGARAGGLPVAAQACRRLWRAPHQLFFTAPHVDCVYCCCFLVADLPAQCDNLVGWPWLDGGTGTKWDPPSGHAAAHGVHSQEPACWPWVWSPMGVQTAAYRAQMCFCCAPLPDHVCLKPGPQAAAPPAAAGLTTDYPSMPAIAQARALARRFQRSIYTASASALTFPRTLPGGEPPARRRGRQGLSAPRQAMRTTLAYLCALCAALRVASAVTPGPLRPSEVFMPHERQMALMPGWEVRGVVIGEHSGVNSSSACVEHCRAALPAGCAFSSFCEDQVRAGRGREGSRQRPREQSRRWRRAAAPHQALPQSVTLTWRPACCSLAACRAAATPTTWARWHRATACWCRATAHCRWAEVRRRAWYQVRVRAEVHGPRAAAVGLAATLACTARHFLAVNNVHHGCRGVLGSFVSGTAHSPSSLPHYYGVPCVQAFPFIVIRAQSWRPSPHTWLRPSWGPTFHVRGWVARDVMGYHALRSACCLCKLRCRRAAAACTPPAAACTAQCRLAAWHFICRSVIFAAWCCYPAGAQSEVEGICAFTSIISAISTCLRMGPACLAVSVYANGE